MRGEWTVQHQGKAPMCADIGGLTTVMRLGNKFIGGIVLNTGKRSYTQDDRIHVLQLTDSGLQVLHCGSK